MAFTYDGTLDTNREKVRLEIGDTDSTAAQFTDAEIDYFLAKDASVIGAAILACKALIAKYARQVNRKVGDLSIDAGERVAHYKELLATLTADGLQTITPFAGGTSIASKQTYEDDTDIPAPAVFRDLHRNPRTRDNGPVTDDRDNGYSW